MTLITVKTTDTTILLKWKVPFDGNAPILYFTVIHNTSSGMTAKNVSWNDFEYNERNLRPATVYSFHVTATNEQGTSDPAWATETTRKAGETGSFYVNNKTNVTILWRFCSVSVFIVNENLS